MSYRARPRQRAGTLWHRRLRYVLSRLFGARLQRAHRIYFVTLNGTRFKRIVLPDSFAAAEIEAALEPFGSTRLFPSAVIRYEKELWLEFVEGEPICAVDADIVSKLASFYADVALRAPRKVPLADTCFHVRLLRDLRTLEQVGVLSDEAHADLSGAAERLAPADVWVGFDYEDPVLKNFVVRTDDGSLCAVDVESLSAGVLIGTGIAKALLFWLEPHRDAFFAELKKLSPPDFLGYLPYVELAFRARWMTRGFFEQKWKYVGADRFERFRAGSGQPGPSPSSRRS